jgi:hypothetical protein
MTLSKKAKKETMARKPEGIPMEEWLNPMKAKKGWGSDVIPQENWIDPAKTYRTRDGKRVEGLQIVLHNSVGEEVTYPVKGTIIVRESPMRKEYAIWTLDGRADLFNESKNDLT